MVIESLTYTACRRLPRVRFVDLRTPNEFAKGALPGACNVPLLSDSERGVVGTLYRWQSSQEAISWALQAVEGRLPEILSSILGRDIPRSSWGLRFAELARRLQTEGSQAAEFQIRTSQHRAEDAAVVVHCWRGGMRSRSVAALLRALGERHVFHLSGGYKAYRRWVINRILEMDSATPAIVLRGATGVGKTRILRRLERLCPGSTIDLEGLAQHRSSVLGDIGLQPATTSQFESALVERLSHLGSPPWFVEGESRKVGDVIIPAKLFTAMQNGHQVHLQADLQSRVEYLGREYLSQPNAHQEILQRLPFLEKRLGKAWVGRLQDWVVAGDWRRVTTVLLEKYYDPLYSRTDRSRLWTAKIKVHDPALTARLLELRNQIQAGEQVSSPCVDSLA